jgi:hypothetical protein
MKSECFIGGIILPSDPVQHPVCRSRRSGVPVKILPDTSNTYRLFYQMYIQGCARLCKRSSLRSRACTHYMSGISRIHRDLFVQQQLSPAVSRPSRPGFSGILQICPCAPSLPLLWNKYIIKNRDILMHACTNGRTKVWYPHNPSNHQRTMQDHQCPRYIWVEPPAARYEQIRTASDACP